MKLGYHELLPFQVELQTNPIPKEFVNKEYPIRIGYTSRSYKKYYLILKGNF